MLITISFHVKKYCFGNLFIFVRSQKEDLPGSRTKDKTPSQCKDSAKNFNQDWKWSSQIDLN